MKENSAHFTRTEDNRWLAFWGGMPIWGNPLVTLEEAREAYRKLADRAMPKVESLKVWDATTATFQDQP